MPTNVTIAEGSKTVGAPVSGDSLFLQGGSAIINTAVDQSGLANGLVAVEVPFAYNGSFGTSAAPFYCEVTSYIWYGAAGGDMYYEGKDGADATPKAYIYGGGHFHFVTDGTITAFHIGGGATATVSAPCIVTSYYIAAATVTILDSTSTDPTLLRIMCDENGLGGHVTTERGGTTFTNEGGKLIIDAGTNTITTLNCTGPHTIASTKMKSSGTITAVNATGHVPDTSNLALPVTITDTTINMALPGANAFLDNPLITFTNAPLRLVTDGR